MLCPSCGAGAPIGQKYCRSCGMDLQPVLAALVEHLSIADTVEGTKGPGTSRSQRADAQRRMIKILALGLVLFIIGLGAAGILTAHFHNKEAGLPGFVILLASMLISMYAVFEAMWPATGSSRPGPRTNSAGQTQRMFYSAPLHVDEPAPSATERTTELIGREGQVLDDGTVP
jgi:hypothetical protein